MTKPIPYKTAEQVIRERNARELKRYHQLRKNLLSGIVFDVSDKLLEILETWRTEDL